MSVNPAVVSGVAIGIGLGAGKLAGYAINRKLDQMKGYRAGVEAAYDAAGVDRKVPKVLTLKGALGLVGSAAAQVYANQKKLGVPESSSYRDAVGIVTAFGEKSGMSVDTDTAEFIADRSIREQARLEHSGHAGTTRVGAALSKAFGSLGDRLTGDRYRRAVAEAYGVAGKEAPHMPRIMTVGRAAGLAYRAAGEAYASTVEKGHGLGDAREKAVATVRAFGAEAGILIPASDVRETFKEVEDRVKKKLGQS